MSLSSLLASDVANVVISTNDFATSVTRYTAGDFTTSSSGSGVLLQTDEVDSLLRGTVETASADFTVLHGDVFRINEELWYVEYAGPVVHGMQSSRVYLCSETVCLHRSVGDVIIKTAMFQPDAVARDDDGFSPTIHTATVQIPAVYYDDLTENPTLTLTIRSTVWDIIDVGVKDNGMVPVAIRRTDTDHSNAFDLQGNQHRYG